MVKLSTRLQKVFKMIPRCGCFADVGCDHGYLSIAVVESGLCDRAIAMDINKGPLECAKGNVISSGLADAIELRLSNGMNRLEKNEADVVCICGMGGLLMKRIIEADLDKAKALKCLIIEPQSEYYELRSFLCENGFVFDDEDLATEENKIYPILSVHYEPGASQLSELELKYGPIILKKSDELLIRQLEKERAEATRIKTALEQKQASEKAIPIQQRITELEKELKLIEEAFIIIGGK